MWWNLIKYQFYPLPPDPIELIRLAQSLRVSLTATWMAHGVLDTAEVQRRIRETLAAFRQGVAFAFAISTAVTTVFLIIALLAIG